MWNKIMEICGFILACIMAIFLGKSHSAKKNAEKEVKQAEEQLKKEQKYKEEAHKIKEEIFQEAEDEKQKLNTGDSTDKFNAAIDILRKH